MTNTPDIGVRVAMVIVVASDRDDRLQDVNLCVDLVDQCPQKLDVVRFDTEQTTGEVVEVNGAETRGRALYLVGDILSGGDVTGRGGGVEVDDLNQEVRTKRCQQLLVHLGADIAFEGRSRGRRFGTSHLLGHQIPLAIHIVVSVGTGSN
jgi:hypothetical protein